MPGKTKLALSPRGEGLVVAEEPEQVRDLIRQARASRDFDGFVDLTTDSGDTLYVAVDQILYIERE